MSEITLFITDIWSNYFIIITTHCTNLPLFNETYTRIKKKIFHIHNTIKIWMFQKSCLWMFMYYGKQNEQFEIINFCFLDNGSPISVNLIKFVLNASTITTLLFQLLVYLYSAVWRRMSGVAAERARTCHPQLLPIVPIDDTATLPLSIPTSSPLSSSKHLPLFSV